MGVSEPDRSSIAVIEEYDGVLTVSFAVFVLLRWLLGVPGGKVPLM